MSIFHVEDPIRIFIDARIVGDNQDAAIFIKNFLFHEGNDHSSSVAVQRSRRLVKNQNLRLADDRPRNRHALLLTTRKLHRQYFAPVFQSDDLQVLGSFGDGFIPVVLF